MSSDQAKILRIGIVQVGSGKVTETRLIKRRDTVSVGSSAKNTFALPSPGLPQSFPLFEMRGGQYHLHFTDKMEGKLSVGEEPQLDFQALVAQGLAKRGGDGSYGLPLSEAMRGKVSWGESTLLFQFIVPPPEPAKMVLPEVARGSWRNVDRLFYAMLLCSLAIHFGLISAVSGREVNEEVSIDQIPDRFAKLIIPEKPITPPKKEEVKAADNAPKKEEKPKEAPKKEKPPPDDAAKAAAAAARRQKLTEQVAQRGLLKLLGADSANGNGAIDDVLGQGSANQDIAQALAGAGGVAVANADSIGAGGRKGGGSGKAAGIGDLSTKGGGNVGLGGKEGTQVRASVSSSAPEVESSTLDREAISKYVKSRQKAIQGCYERELKLAPTLKGKIAVRITINTQGKVADTEIDEDTLHSDAVVSCIKGLLRFWKFPFTPDSDSAVQFSWNFVSSS